jgi:hypothetical protein
VTGRNIAISIKEQSDSDVIQEAKRIKHVRRLHVGRKGKPDRERQAVQRDENEDRTAQKRI